MRAGTEAGGNFVCIKMQRSAYCVCSLTFHARCWPGDVLSRAPLWCQDRHSLHQRSNNSCSKTQQVSSGNKFSKVGCERVSNKFSINKFSSLYRTIYIIFFFPTSDETPSETTDVDVRVCRLLVSLTFIIIVLDTSNASRNLFGN